MTRDDKAALRAKARELRRRPREERDDEPRQEEAAADEEPRQEEEPQTDNGRSRSREQPQQPQQPRHGAAPDELPGIADHAREVLRSLRGVDAESVSGLARTAKGWRVALEVVELRRIPESTDVLASYEVELDEDGGLLNFSRGRRYHRAQAELDGRR